MRHGRCRYGGTGINDGEAPAGAPVASVYLSAGHDSLHLRSLEESKNIDDHLRALVCHHVVSFRDQSESKFMGVPVSRVPPPAYLGTLTTCRPSALDPIGALGLL